MSHHVTFTSCYSEIRTATRDTALTPRTRYTTLTPHTTAAETGTRRDLGGGGSSGVGLALGISQLGLGLVGTPHWDWHSQRDWDWGSSGVELALGIRSALGTSFATGLDWDCLLALAYAQITCCLACSAFANATYIVIGSIGHYCANVWSEWLRLPAGPQRRSHSLANFVE